MHVHPVSIPVKLPDQYEGLASAAGILKTEPAGIVLEFEIKDAVLGVIRSGVRESLIAWDHIDAVRLKSGLFGCRIEVATRSMRAVEGIPGADRGMVSFNVERRNRERAEEFVTGAMLALSEHRLNAALNQQELGELPE